MIQNQQTKSQGVKSELKIMHCPHVHRRHYAKKMCMSCYHRIGRTKKAWACPHPYKLHYSKGLCQNCYLSKYYHDKKAERNQMANIRVTDSGDLSTKQQLEIPGLPPDIN